jgi:hypothetical protein
MIEAPGARLFGCLNFALEMAGLPAHSSYPRWLQESYAEFLSTVDE